jgi:predicted amidophosphoribosyltransferase
LERRLVTAVFADDNYPKCDYCYIIHTVARVHPTEIHGPWHAGFVLDVHTTSTKFIGRNPGGRPVYKNKYTELGELVHRLKYYDDDSASPDIVETIVDFLTITWKPLISMIIPMPPSKARNSQPVVRLAYSVGKRLGVDVSFDAVKKVKKPPQLKDIVDFESKCRLLAAAFRVRGPIVSGHNVLLLDDLYDSGATMYSVTNALRSEGSVA